MQSQNLQGNKRTSKFYFNSFRFALTGRMEFALKVFVTSVTVVLISEAAKRWTLLGAVIASLPLTSVLAMIWLYLDTKNPEQVASLSYGIFWVVIPSLVFFVLMPLFIKQGWNFWLSLGLAATSTAFTYSAYLFFLKKLGFQL